MYHDFEKDLIDGKKMEERFLSEPFFSHRLSCHTHYKEDFVFNSDKTKIVELKTEAKYTQYKQYVGKKFFGRSAIFTQNLFIEHLSVAERGTIGGPWVSKKNGVFMLMHYFPHEREVYIFDPNNLVALLERHVQGSRLLNRGLVSIPNNGYTTQGWPVSIEWLCNNMTVGHLDLINKKIGIKK